MAIILEHIDKIAREKGRDVLFVEFGAPKDRKSYTSAYKFEKDHLRAEILQWLDEHNIAYEMCADVASEYGWRAYRGQIYLDVLPDESNEVYALLNDYFEDENGKNKFEDVILYILPLTFAMENAHHDEPGFWDRWAENF